MSLSRDRRSRVADSGGPQFDETVQLQTRPKMSFGNLFRDIDVFGHPVSLNIGGRSSKHTTICGGFCSLLVFVLVVLHIYYQMVLILSGDLDRTVVAPFVRNSTEMGEKINLHEDSIGIFMYMYDVNKDVTEINPLSTKYTDVRRQIVDPFDKDLELERFINIEFVQYRQKDNQEIVHKIKKCFRTDFANASQVWDNYLTYDWALICPENLKKAELQESNYHPE